MVTIELDGIKFTTTEEEAIKILKGDKTPKGFYRSESKGWVRISKMDENHIRNALTKRVISYYEDLKGIKSTQDYLDGFLNMAKDPTIRELFNELESR